MAPPPVPASKKSRCARKREREHASTHTNKQQAVSLDCRIATRLSALRFAAFSCVVSNPLALWGDLLGRRPTHTRRAAHTKGRGQSRTDNQPRFGATCKALPSFHPCNNTTPPSQHRRVLRPALSRRTFSSVRCFPQLPAYECDTRALGRLKPKGRDDGRSLALEGM